ncbi:hypothetical protein IP84_13940 [beta proteobacterium AAP99]|nr:hypothetical protein IP84_13940 [beta proteobacterium AAP99]
MRGRLQSAYDSRGKATASLWYVYSAKASADVCLHGDTHYYHYLLVESDPTISSVEYNYASKARGIAGDPIGDAVSVRIETREKAVVWRCVCSEPSKELSTLVENTQTLIERKAYRSLPDRIEVVTAEEVIANPIRIQNWNRLMPYLAQAQALPLQEYGNDVAALLHTRSTVTLIDVVALARESNHVALHVAALVRGVQLGRYESDLNEQPLSDRSTFWSAK